MAMDSVDDLHHAEDWILTAAKELAELGRPGWADDYCRPTCGGEGAPCGDSTCGCLCHEREPA